jgi:hypothetical protein
MSEKPTVQELTNRICRDIKHYGGTLPERVAIAWAGYLSALLEWGLLSPPEHRRLRSLLPEIENSPVYDIMVGRDDAEP